MSNSSYKLGLVTEDQYKETIVTDDELSRACDLLDGLENPLTGFEIHLLKTLRHDSLPITPKEKAMIEAMNDRGSNFRRDLGHERFQLTSDEQEENDEILNEMWGNVDDCTRSNEDGWFYEN